MRNFASFAAVGLSVFLAGSALAQTSTEPAADATEDTTTQAPAAPAPSGDTAPAADAEQLAAAPEEQPSETVVEVHGDWQIRCRTENEKACFMYQLAIDAREIPISEVSLVPLDSEDGRVAGFTIVTPLRTLLTEGLALQIDNGRVQKYQFGWCTQAGCAVRFAVLEDGLAQFKQGNKMRLTVLNVENPDKPVVLDVSLKGFTAGFADLQERVK